jgi:DNA mismatch repair ATPase MutS
MEKSYGIEVMKMLKFPPEVVAMAEGYLECYEQQEEKDEALKDLTE